MKVVSLMDNVAWPGGYLAAHGLSFYIEACGHKILFDAGPDEQFLENARMLGVDLAQVDLAVLSHGHYDHGGGMEAFLRLNSRASLHLQKGATKNYYAHDPERIRYIGLSQDLKNSSRILIHDVPVLLAEGILLFGGVTGRQFASPANGTLYQEEGQTQTLDTFSHEQNLLLIEEDHSVLVAGCAHNGIVNILEKAKTLTAKPITHVFGGMHLKGLSEMEAFTRPLGERLQKETTIFYTCHCTSQEGYAALHTVMGDQIQYLAAGAEVKIP